MAVKTRLSQSDIATIILNYDIGQIVDFKGIVEGVENTNYLLRTTDGKFILTLFEDRVKTSDLPFFEALLVHLYENHINIPYFIPNKSGSSFFSAKAKRGVIIPFFPGKPILKNFKPDHLKELGRYLAKFHLAGQDFEQERENPFSLYNCQKHFMNLNSRNYLEGISDDLLRDSFEQILSTKRDLPAGIIHADLFPDNVFFIDNKIEAIIDPYFSCTDVLIYDVAICATAWCFNAENRMDKDLIIALLKGYGEIRQLTNDEIFAFRDYCLLAAIRFFLTRVEDFFKMDEGEIITKKSPDEYYDKIEAFYNWKGITKR